MVLVSHSHKFVFLKTRKTAGTSIEMLLEPFCAPPGHVPVEKTEGMVTPHGVIGHRLLDLDEDEHTWREHLPAKEIRRQIGKLTWMRYFRFTAVRNPFDRAVSYFHWLHDFEGAALPAGFDEIRDTFRRFVAAGRLKTDYAVTHLHRKLAFQDAVRYEHLGQDLARICAQLKLDVDPDRLPRTKANTSRRNGQTVSAYYDTATADIIRTDMAWVFDRFGYPTDPQACDPAKVPSGCRDGRD